MACISLFGLSLSTVRADDNPTAIMNPQIKVNGSWVSASSGAVAITAGTPYEVIVYFSTDKPMISGHRYAFHWDFHSLFSTFTLDTVSMRYKKPDNSDQYYNFTSRSSFTTRSGTGNAPNCFLVVNNIPQQDGNGATFFQIRCFMTFTGQTASGASSAYFQIQNSTTSFEDITDLWYLEQVEDSINTTNDKLDSTNDKLDESNQKKQTIIDRITNLPTALRDMLLGFFVPTDEDFNTFIDDFNDLVYLRLGCVAQTLDFFGDIIDSFIYATAESQIYIPRLEISIPINNGQVVAFHTLTLWSGGYINVMPTEWAFASSNIDYIRTIIDIICLFMLFRYLLNVFYSIVSPEVTESMTLHEILEELEMRTLD